MTHQKPITASEVCDALGRRLMADRLGVGLTAISNASVLGQFSPRWYKVIKSLCAEASVDCPDHLFSFIPVATTCDANIGGAA